MRRRRREQRRLPADGVERRDGHGEDQHAPRVERHGRVETRSEMPLDRGVILGAERLRRERVQRTEEPDGGDHDEPRGGTPEARGGERGLTDVPHHEGVHDPHGDEPKLHEEHLDALQRVALAELSARHVHHLGHPALLSEEHGLIGRIGPVGSTRRGGADGGGSAPVGRPSDAGHPPPAMAPGGRDETRDTGVRQPISKRRAGVSRWRPTCRPIASAPRGR